MSATGWRHPTIVILRVVTSVSAAGLSGNLPKIMQIIHDRATPELHPRWYISEYKNLFLSECPVVRGDSCTGFLTPKRAFSALLRLLVSKLSQFVWRLRLEGLYR